MMRVKYRLEAWNPLESLLIHMGDCCAPYFSRWFQMTLLLFIHAKPVQDMSWRFLSSSLSYNRKLNAECAIHLNKAGRRRTLNPFTSTVVNQIQGVEDSENPNLPSATALYKGSSNSPQGCLFCDSTSHKSGQCTDNTVSMRKERLKNTGRCSVCLGQWHVAKFCRIKGVSCSVWDTTPRCLIKVNKLNQIVLKRQVMPSSHVWLLTQ